MKYTEINKMRLGSYSGIVSLINNIYFKISEEFATEINLVFQNTPQYFPPFSMLFLGLSIKQMAEKFNVNIYFSNYEQKWLGYAAHFGFFHLSRFDYGKGLGEAKGGGNYIPLTCLRVPDANIDLDEIHAKEVERMQAIGDSLARHLLKTDDGEAFVALSYLCREILRNVIEHSYSDTMYYCAQFFPRKNVVEVCIADEGEGVREGLNQNPKLSIDSDKDAVKFAILPGMSGRSHKYRGKRSSAHIYANSGYGLYLTQKICSNAGAFLMVSNSHGISIKGNNRIYIPRVHFTGTIIKLTIELDGIGNLEGKIKEYRKLAECIIRDNKRLEKISPSAASMMLRI